MYCINTSGWKTSTLNITMVDVQTLLQACMNMSLRYACFTDEVFPEKAKRPVLGLLSSSAGLSEFPNHKMLD
jgi:tellurite resistance protein